MKAEDKEPIMKEFMRSFLAFSPERDKEFLEVLASCKERHIWIFGAAGIGISVKRWLAEKNCAVYSFCDNSQAKIGTVVDGILVRSFSELCQDQNRFVLIAVWKYYDEIALQCERAGVRFFDAAPLSGVVFDTVGESSVFVSENMQRISSIYQKLADSRSGQIYFAAQAARIFRERGAMKPYRSAVQYIEPEIVPLGERETIFLCGAGNGSSAIALSKAANREAKIYAFEPDAENYALLRKAVGHISNIHCVEMGVGKRSGTSAFCGGMGENSTFAIAGDRSVEITSIDDYVKSSGVIPSYITMDIEGWEMEALHGAERTIVRHKPKMAVSLYHRASDFAEVPEWILGLRPDYKMYVRHYTDSYSDTIAYFI